MKKLIAILIVFAASFMLIAGGTQEAADDGSTLIGVSKLLSHAALDAVEQGLQDYLATTGLNVRYDFQNANGDISTAASISQLFDDEDCDIVIGIGTATAQSLANTFTDRPVLFAAVTDPADAGLVADNYTPDPESNICGVSDMTPVEEQIKLLSDITGAKVIGNVYSSGEQNGVVLMEMAQEACDNLGLEFVPVAVSNSSEVMMAAQSIIDRVDAMYVSTDNTVISAIASLSEVCSGSSIPLFSADTTSSFGTDVLLAGGFDYYESGRLTGEVIKRVLDGEQPEAIGTLYLENLEIYVNLDTAAALGIEIPEDILKSASFIIKDGAEIQL